MAEYTYSIFHELEKLLYTVDALSRAPLTQSEALGELEEEVEAYVERVVDALQVSEQRLQLYRGAQNQDTLCSQVMKYSQTEWLGKYSLLQNLIPFWNVRQSLIVHTQLLLYNSQIVISKSLQRDHAPNS